MRHMPLKYEDIKNLNGFLVSFLRLWGVNENEGGKKESIQIFTMIFINWRESLLEGADMLLFSMGCYPSVRISSATRRKRERRKKW